MQLGIAASGQPSFWQYQSLYTPAQGGSTGWVEGIDAKSLIWTETKQKAFEALKATLTSAPVLPLLDVSKPSHLFVHDERILIQTLGPGKHPVTTCPNEWTL